MQLRETVKAPRRLENETAIEERQLEVTRRTKGRTPHRYVDYNPKLPPAAFPTLEKPRTSKEFDNRSISQDETTLSDDGRTSVARTHYPKSHNVCNSIKMAETNLASIPTDLLENSIASNCDLNPVYEKNMMKMVNAGKTIGMEEMDDSDPGHHSDEAFDFDNLSEAIPISNPNWGDLSPRIQVEIFDNFCKDHKSSVASQILGLTDAERDKTQVYMDQREKQINLENLQLQRMRDRQLTSLLSIDNSDPKQSQTPYNQKFHQTSRKYSHKLEEALKIDFFSCHAGELVNAQRFLDQRGLNVDHAGEWCNGTSTWRNVGCEDQTYEAKSDEDQIASQPTSGAAYESLDISLTERERHMPRYPGSPKDLFMRQGDYKLLSEQLLMSHEENMEENTYREPLNGNFSLTKKVPKHRLNRVFESEHPFIEPLKLVKTLPPMIRWHYSKPPSKCNVPENPASQAGRDYSTSIMSPFARLKQRLEEAKAKLHQQPHIWMEHSQAKSEPDSDDHRSSTCSLLVGQDIFSDETCSRLASPSRILREKSPEAIRPDSLFLPEDAENQRATSISGDESGAIVYAPTAMASNVSRSPSQSPSSLGFHDQSMATLMESSPDAQLADTAGGSDMDDDCDGDVDEMVMVPTGPRKTVD